VKKRAKNFLEVDVEMSYIIPFSELDIAEIAAIKQQVIDALFSVAMKMTGLTRDQLVIRNLLPKTDLGLTNEYWETPSLTANDWTNYFTKQLAEQQFVVFYGVANLAPDPKATALRFKVGSEAGTKTLDVVQLEELYTNTVRTDGFFKRPIIYKERQYSNVDVYSKATGTDPLMLRGFVAEPAGRVTF